MLWLNDTKLFAIVAALEALVDLLPDDGEIA